MVLSRRISLSTVYNYHKPGRKISKISRIPERNFRPGMLVGLFAWRSGFPTGQGISAGSEPGGRIPGQFHIGGDEGRCSGCSSGEGAGRWWATAPSAGRCRNSSAAGDPLGAGQDVAEDRVGRVGGRLPRSPWN